MIKVTGQNPGTLWRRMEHHAEELILLAHALIDGLIFGQLGQSDEVHVIRQHKAGANSFSLRTAAGQTYHFRSHDYRTIEVMDAFKHGSHLATIANRDEAQAFVERVEREIVGAAAA
jgi:tryptophan 2,3-dioxygenase